MLRYKVKKRVFFIFYIFLILLIILGIRIAYLMNFKNKALSVKADSQYYYDENIKDLNYTLLDCNSKDLMDYEIKYYFVVDPLIFETQNRDTSIEELYALTYILKNYNKDYDISQIHFKDTKKKLYYSIDKNTYNKLKSIKNIRGVYSYKFFQSKSKENWAIENLITQTRKPKNGELKSLNSIEMKIYNKIKNNQYDKVRFYKDIDRNIIKKETLHNDKNINVKLTIDKNIQNIIKNTLNKYEDFEQVGVILTESSTGKIKSLAIKNDNLPNVNLGSATENGFCPGSIFKIIVEEAALDTAVINTNSNFICKMSPNSICKREHGHIKLDKAFAMSCNNSFAAIGQKVGFDTIIKYAKAQGIFNNVLGFDSSINNKEEVSGDYLVPNEKSGGISLISIGQNMRITPIQAINIVNTIANDGVYVKPYIIDSFTQGTKTLEKFNAIENRVLKPSVSNIIKNQMIKVVNTSYGTGKLAHIDGMKIGGKTGTTERVEPSKVKGKFEKHSDGWFLGFFTLNNKQYSMIVFVKDINKDTQAAGTTAAPIFKDIVENLKYYTKNN